MNKRRKGEARRKAGGGNGLDSRQSAHCAVLAFVVCDACSPAASQSSARVFISRLQQLVMSQSATIEAFERAMDFVEKNGAPDG